MRVSIDANVLISFLLNPTSGSPPATVILGGLSGDYQLCISTALLDEVFEKISSKPYLSRRITQRMADELVVNLTLTAEMTRDVAVEDGFPVRDPKDRYLIAHAIAVDVDYLVSGDRDLLEIEHDFGFRIVTPAGFVTILGKHHGET